MPAYQSGQSICLHFGWGDIGVCLGRNVTKSFEDELVFSPSTPHVIGEPTTELEGKTTDEIPAPVRMIFENVESLDVVVDQLNLLRQKIVDAKGAA